MTQSQSQNRPKIAYRLELQKKIQINKSYSERRNQATALRILSYGLFGQKRYQNLYLSCSLNCFYYALKIANTMHERVPGLSMLIKFQTAHVIEYYSEPFEQKMYCQKNYSKIIIKLTKTPTKEDKQQPGFNAGLPAQQIQQPITEVIIRPERKAVNNNNRRGSRNNRGKFNNNFSQNNRDQRSYNQQSRHQSNRSFNNDYRRNYSTYQQDSSFKKDRNDQKDFKKKEYLPKYGDDRYQTKYGDDRDQRRIRRNRQEDLEQDDYRRGQTKTRGSNYHNKNNVNYERNQRDRGDDRYKQNQKDKRNNKNLYQNDSSRYSQNRSERKPQRKNRYNQYDD